MKVFRLKRGNTIIEAALIMPILVYLGFGMVEFGYFFYVKHNMTAASREGARAGIVSGSTNASVTSAITSVMTAAGLTGKYNTPTITDTSGNALDVSVAASGTLVEVTVTATWGTIGQGMRPMSLIPSSKTVTTSVVMRKE